MADQIGREKPRETLRARFLRDLMAISAEKRVH